jgi:hypothetical protein
MFMFTDIYFFMKYVVQYPVISCEVLERGTSCTLSGLNAEKCVGISHFVYDTP